MHVLAEEPRQRDLPPRPTGTNTLTSSVRYWSITVPESIASDENETPLIHRRARQLLLQTRRSSRGSNASSSYLIMNHAYVNDVGNLQRDHQRREQERAVIDMEDDTYATHAQVATYRSAT